MDKAILTELQNAVLRSVRKRKARGAKHATILRFLRCCLELFNDPRMRLFLLVVMAVEIKEAKNKKPEVVI